MIPLHAIAAIGGALSPDYFSPGTYEVGGQITGSPWAIAYWHGVQYRYERNKLGAPWVRVS